MADAGDGQSLLDPETLRRLLRHLEQTDVNELEVVAGSSRLYLRREPGVRVVDLQTVPVSEAGPDRIPIVAPLAGLFYTRPTPADLPFIEVGTEIVPGQVVALIETMKIFNEIKSEVAGEIVEITCQDGDLVEAGKPLIYVRPPQGGNE